jgi:hypothetical protein
MPGNPIILDINAGWHSFFSGVLPENPPCSYMRHDKALQKEQFSLSAEPLPSKYYCDWPKET